MTEQEMFREYDEIINKLLWKHNQDLWDDLRSEAYLRFVEVRDNYDPNKGRFFSLAYWCIENAMMNYIRKETGNMMRKNTFNSLDNFISGGNGDDSTFIDSIEDNTGNFMKNLMIRDYVDKHIYGEKDEFKRKVRILHYVEGYSIRDINASLGLKFNNPHDKQKLLNALKLNTEI